MLNRQLTLRGLKTPTEQEKGQNPVTRNTLFKQSPWQKPYQELAYQHSVGLPYGPQQIPRTNTANLNIINNPNNLSKTESTKHAVQKSKYFQAHSQNRKVINQINNKNEFNEQRQDSNKEGKIFFQPKSNNHLTTSQAKNNQLSHEEQRLSIESVEAKNLKMEKACEKEGKVRYKRSSNRIDTHSPRKSVPTSFKNHKINNFFQAFEHNLRKIEISENFVQNPMVFSIIQKNRNQIVKRTNYLTPDSIKIDQPDINIFNLSEVEIPSQIDTSIEERLNEENLIKTQKILPERNKNSPLSIQTVRRQKQINAKDILKSSNPLKQERPNLCIKKSLSSMIKKQCFEESLPKQSPKKQQMVDRRLIPQMIEEYYIKRPDRIQQNIYRPSLKKQPEQRSRSSPMVFTGFSSNSVHILPNNGERLNNQAYLQKSPSRMASSSHHYSYGPCPVLSTEKMTKSISEIKFTRQNIIISENFSFPQNFHSLHLRTNSPTPRYQNPRREERPLVQTFSSNPIIHNYSHQSKRGEPLPKNFPPNKISTPQHSFSPISMYGLIKHEQTPVNTLKTSRSPSKKKLQVFGRISKQK